MERKPTDQVSREADQEMKEGARTGRAVRSKKHQDFWSRVGAAPGGPGPGEPSSLKKAETQETVWNSAVATTAESGFFSDLAALVEV